MPIAPLSRAAMILCFGECLEVVLSTFRANISFIRRSARYGDIARMARSVIVTRSMISKRRRCRIAYNFSAGRHSISYVIIVLLRVISPASEMNFQRDKHKTMLSRHNMSRSRLSWCSTPRLLEFHASSSLKRLSAWFIIFSYSMCSATARFLSGITLPGQLYIRHSASLCPRNEAYVVASLPISIERSVAPRIFAIGAYFGYRLPSALVEPSLPLEFI